MPQQRGLVEQHGGTFAGAAQNPVIYLCLVVDFVLALWKLAMFHHRTPHTLQCLDKIDL